MSDIITREKQPSEIKELQFKLDFLAQGESLSNNTFAVKIVELVEETLLERTLDDTVRAVSVSFISADSIDTQQFSVQSGQIRVFYHRGDLADVTDEMLVPGTLVWEPTLKIARFLVRGGENGKTYKLTITFHTTLGRVREVDCLLKVKEI